MVAMAAAGGVLKKSWRMEIESFQIRLTIRVTIDVHNSLH